MKHKLLLALVICAVSAASAQKVHITDLLTWYKLSVPDIDKAVSRKHFHFIRKAGDDIADMKSFTYFWAWNFKEEAKDASEWFTVSTYEGANSRLVYETSVKANFETFVSDLRKHGFRFLENVKHPDLPDLSSYYTNEVYLVIVQPREDRWTIYFREK